MTSEGAHGQILVLTSELRSTTNLQIYKFTNMLVLTKMVTQSTKITDKKL